MAWDRPTVDADREARRQGGEGQARQRRGTATTPAPIGFRRSGYWLAMCAIRGPYDLWYSFLPSRAPQLMNIQLIHPPVYINKHGLTALRPSLPLGLAYIASVLREDGHQVSVLDALALAPNRMTPEGDIWRLGADVTDVVGRVDPAVEAIGVTSMW